jgi:hypothetical protein
MEDKAKMFTRQITPQVLVLNEFFLFGEVVNEFFLMSVSLYLIAAILFVFTLYRHNDLLAC